MFVCLLTELDHDDLVPNVDLIQMVHGQQRGEKMRPAAPNWQVMAKAANWEPTEEVLPKAWAGTQADSVHVKGCLNKQSIQI